MRALFICDFATTNFTELHLMYSDVAIFENHVSVYTIFARLIVTSESDCEVDRR